MNALQVESGQTLLGAPVSAASQGVTRKKGIAVALIGFLLVACVIIGVSISGASSSTGNNEVISEGTEPQTDGERPMIRYDLTEMMNDDTLLCNDGTEAIYYFRESTDPNEDRWLIRFEGKCLFVCLFDASVIVLQVNF
jgi:hypothetical protein